jgi:hypothetical protein
MVHAEVWTDDQSAARAPDTVIACTSTLTPHSRAISASA